MTVLRLKEIVDYLSRATARDPQPQHAAGKFAIRRIALELQALAAKITPAAQQSDGANEFKVEAEVAPASRRRHQPQQQPGVGIQRAMQQILLKFSGRDLALLQI